MRYEELRLEIQISAGILLPRINPTATRKAMNIPMNTPLRYSSGDVQKKDAGISGF
jgi:hypothetical protein